MGQTRDRRDVSNLVGHHPGAAYRAFTSICTGKGVWKISTMLSRKKVEAWLLAPKRGPVSALYAKVSAK